MVDQESLHSTIPPVMEALHEMENEFDARGLFTLAVWHQSCGHIDLAMRCYRRAVQSSPSMAEAFYNMGVLCYERRQWISAVRHFKKALTIQPDNARIAFNLAAAYKEDARYAEAIEAYQATLKRDPGSHEAHYHLARCYQETGNHPAALESFKNAIQLDPENAMMWFRMAESVRKCKTIDEALQCYQTAVRIKPDWDVAHYNLGVALRIKGRFRPAIRHIQKAIELNPDFADAHGHLFRLAQHVCDWSLMEQAETKLDAITTDQLARSEKTAELPMVSIRRRSDPASNLEIARSWSRFIARESASLSPRPVFHHRNRYFENDRIRIGYLSGDFKDHAVAHQIRGMLASHNRNQFDIIGYACNPDDGTAYRKYLESACDQLKPIHELSDTEAAQLIYDDGIQILVDLSTHSRDNRMGISALRPAPIQVSYLGFLGSTGADFIDYAIADKIVVPPSEMHFFSEKIVYMPHCYQANDNRLTIANRSFSRDEFNLPPHGTVFCSFNQSYKIDKQLFEIWMNILKQIQDGVLWLVHRSELAKENLMRAAASAHVDPSRLIFTGFMPLELNLARLKLADLVLDTRIYNGGATTSNALWAGVPVVTLLGRHWVSRMSASALVALDLPELVTTDLKSYQQLALDLARNPAKLKALRSKLAANRNVKPLFDTALFTKHIETAFGTMWERYASGLPPVSFEITALA